MIFIAGITIAVFIEFLLLAKKEKSQGDVILSLWIFSMAIQLFTYYLFVTGKVFEYPFLLGIEHPLPLVQGVFLYWYVGAITDQLPKNRKWIALHFLPTLAAYLYMYQFFILPPEGKIYVYQNDGAGFVGFEIVRYIGILLSGVVYISWSIVLLIRYRRSILDRFSFQDRIDLQWLYILTWGLGAIWLLILVSDDVLFMGASVFVILIAFFGIRQARIAPRHMAPDEIPKEKYQKSGLTEELSDKIYASLIKLMKEKFPHRRQDLSIDDLASELSVPSNYLSQVINEREKKNFYDFVNGYRIEEFKQLVSDPKNSNLTLLALAYDCGFNSKSSFNRYFKKATGQTPSQFFAARA